MAGTAVTTYLTIASIFFLYLASILLRYSGLISMAAKLKAEFFRPALWHSITVDVRMGTMSAMQMEDEARSHLSICLFWQRTGDGLFEEEGMAVRSGVFP